jgi:hypothetical protein
MKKLLSLLVFISVISYSQDLSLTMGNTGYVNFVLKTPSTDTVDVALGGTTLINDYVIYTQSTATDSVLFWVKQADTLYAQQGLQDLASGSNVTFIVATTAGKMYKILDPKPKKVRFTLPTPLDSSNVVIIIERRFRP